MPCFHLDGLEIRRSNPLSSAQAMETRGWDHYSVDYARSLVFNFDEDGRFLKKSGFAVQCGCDGDTGLSTIDKLVLRDKHLERGPVFTVYRFF